MANFLGTYRTLESGLFDAIFSRDPFRRRPVLPQVRLDANRLSIAFQLFFFSFFDTRGIRVCVFLDKASFYNLKGH